MKKSSVVVLALLNALMLVLGSCDNPADSSSSEQPKVVSIAAIQGVASPVTGATPVTAVTATEQYAGTIAWSPAVSSTFAAEIQYTAAVTLTAKTGYTLQGVAADFFTVAGATSVHNAANSGVVTAVFPATGSIQLPEVHWSELMTHQVNPVMNGEISEDNTQGEVTNIITSTVVEVAAQVESMRKNVALLTEGNARHNLPDGNPDKIIGVGFPSQNFLGSIVQINGFVFQGGSAGEAIECLRGVAGTIASEWEMTFDDGQDIGEFGSYTDAMIALSYAYSKTMVNDDYDVEIRISDLMGHLPVAGYLWNIIDKDGNPKYEELPDFYPSNTELHASAMSLIKDSDTAYPQLVDDALTIMVNYARMLGMLERAQDLGFDTTFTKEATDAIYEATKDTIEVVTPDKITIDKPQGGFMQFQRSRPGDNH